MFFSLIIREIQTHDGRVFTAGRSCFRDVEYGVQYCEGFWCTDTIYREQIFRDRTTLNVKFLLFLIIVAALLGAFVLMNPPTSSDDMNAEKLVSPNSNQIAQPDTKVSHIYALKPCPFNNTPLKRHSKGQNVKNLQELLSPDFYKETIDGDYGSATEQAVRQFQSDQGIAADGKVGKQTLQKLAEKHGCQLPDTYMIAAHSP